MKPRSKFLLTRILPAPFLIMGAVALCLGIVRLLKAKASTDWPTVQGTVTSSAAFSSLSSSTDGGSTIYEARIRYEFSLNGRVYTGARISYGDHGTNEREYADSIVDLYPEDKEVAVYYLPDKPEECLLEPGRSGGAWLLPGLGLLFLSIGILLTVLLSKAVKMSAKPEPRQQ